LGEDGLPELQLELWVQVQPQIRVFVTRPVRDQVLADHASHLPAALCILVEADFFDERPKEFFLQKLKVKKGPFLASTNAVRNTLKACTILPAPLLLNTYNIVVTHLSDHCLSVLALLLFYKKGQGTSCKLTCTAAVSEEPSELVVELDFLVGCHLQVLFY